MSYNLKLRISELASSVLLIVILLSCLFISRCDAQQKQGSGVSGEKRPPAAPSIFKVFPFWVNISGSLADISTSMVIIDGQRFKEANPLWRTRDGRFSWPRNLAFTAALTVAEWQVWKRHPRLGRALLLANGLVRGYVGARNLLRSRRRAVRLSQEMNP